MITRYSLSQMRDVWIDAYLHGDTEQLHFVQSPHFFVMHKNKILTKIQQIAQITRRRSEQAVHYPHVSFRHDVTSIIDGQLWTTISGFGEMRRGDDTLSRFEFLELWLISDNRWQIASLCYEECTHNGSGFDDEPRQA
jgi:hypothetical protein